MGGSRVKAAPGVLTAAVLLAACGGPSTPMVGSERRTSDDLVADLREAGVCPRGPTLTAQGSGPLAGTDADFGTCSDDYQVIFFPPTGNISTLFNPIVCQDWGGRDATGIDQSPRPVVWGLNWVVLAPIKSQDTSGLQAIADTTMGELTTDDAMYAVYCDALAAS